MKRRYVAFGVVVATVAAIGGVFAVQYERRERNERLRYEREETELIVANPAQAPVRLFKAGKSLGDAQEVSEFNGERAWLERGEYFLSVEQSGRILFYPVSIFSYRGGPDDDGALTITIRSLPPDLPPRLLTGAPEFAYIPSGPFLMGDRLNQQDPHYVWLTGYFMSPFEVTNGEFREFFADPTGYADDSNWTEAGRRWKAGNPSRGTVLLRSGDDDFKRFGQADQPVVGVNWFEGNAYCRWLTRKLGGKKWIFALPNEAEWEKAARGPDSFDYALGTLISDEQVKLYNWKKNPGAEVTVVGLRETLSKYITNRYGLFHMSGNASEWTQTISRAYSRRHPYLDDDRNKDDMGGDRVVRGGSWYSASIAILYLPYRENFQPEVTARYLGFRIVARPLP
jgi:formylglycine-generating enzyme required for sulfatase activity